MFLTFPLECFVCREVIVNYLFAHPASTGSLAGLHGVNERVSTQKHVLITVVLSLSALAVALATCDLGFVLELTVSDWRCKACWRLCFLDYLCPQTRVVWRVPC